MHEGGVRWALGALLVIYSQTGLAAGDPAAPLIKGSGVQILQTPAGIYAVRPSTVVAGDVLASGSQNLQPTLLQCAESCSGHPGCSAFNYCTLQGGCDYLDDWAPQGSCELLVKASSQGIGVFELASDTPLLPSGGIRHVGSDPGPLDGYVELFARTLLATEYDLSCNDTIVKGKCVVASSLEEAKEHCDVMPGCQAIGYGLPSSTGPLGPSSIPIVSYFGSPAGQPIQISKTNLTPLMALYVKVGQLAMPADETVGSASSASSGSASPSAGAIAGIAIGAACAASLLLAGTFFLWRTRRLQGVEPSLRLAKLACLGSARSSQCHASGQASHTGPPPTEESCCHCGRQKSLPLRGSDSVSSRNLEHGTGRLCPPDPALPSASSGSLRSAKVSEMLADAAGPQWDDVLVDRSAVQLYRDAYGKLVKLGAGTSGDVYRATLHGSTVCAAKVFWFGNEPSNPQHFIQEVRTLWKVSHPNIVQFIGASVTNDHGLLLMELMAGGDLHSRLQTELPDNLGRLFAWHNRGHRVALQIAIGLAYLHRHRIVHLDLKPSNVLLTREGRAKLGDVGFSRFMPRGCISNLDSRLGTFQYAAPEVLLGTTSTEKADIWSYGVLLYELCSGEAPRRGALRPLSPPGECPEEVAALQQRCLASDPEQRPSAEELVEELRRHSSVGRKAQVLSQACQRGSAAGCVGEAAALATAAAAGAGAESRLSRSVRLAGCTAVSPFAAAASPRHRTEAVAGEVFNERELRPT